MKWRPHHDGRRRRRTEEEEEGQCGKEGEGERKRERKERKRKADGREFIYFSFGRFIRIQMYVYVCVYMSVEEE